MITWGFQQPLVIAMKICRGCGEQKPLDQFYKHPATKDGFATKCKECAKSIVKSARIKNADHYKAYDSQRANDPGRVAARSAYAKTDAGKAAHRKACKKYIDNNPKRRAAQLAVGNAIRSGRLIALPCFECGMPAEAHHPDYDRPLDVVWLCPLHHKQVHAMV